MGTFCIDWMFSFTDSMLRPIQKEDVQIETFVVYLNVLELIGRA